MYRQLLEIECNNYADNAIALIDDADLLLAISHQSVLGLVHLKAFFVNVS